ncbi:MULTISPECIES: DUF1501 domain-containing protein [unclassified Caulobacter]|uniref:DUF1501 domain-containing protein n=1 Tax=unclassified Caulobacter TaxID=2648921 RepID=UPI0006FAD43F|nr:MULTISPECIES: DUF1501 domain-containing protein [unclassified Caulobacter]KQV56813.1 hypothetical protein ASC62_10945 [Caulobacter sp. Root342]KQV72452.1 hypothetical protein ASC70_01895 [Caulobacter sp. Root343]
MTIHANRRSFLGLAAGLGISVNFLGTQAFAASEGDLAKKKLVVVICRGGMDGLSVSPPVGDPNYAGLRGSIAMTPDQVLKLDDTFSLHPQLDTVHKLALKGEARIAPAIASPDRARSHFEAQDVLETGAAHVYGTETGWLNRTLEALAPVRKVEGLSVGTTAPLILRGKVQAASWSPGKGVDETARLPTLLQDLYRNDPMLGPAFARGLETETMAQQAMTAMAPSPAMNLAAASTPAMAAPAPMSPTPISATMANDRQNRAGGEAARKLGATLGGFMIQAGGPQIAAISLDGFDTHAGQVGQIATRLSYLDAVLDGLHTGLGAEWKNTVVIAVTEFGRTARVNGTGGTDHGTASTGLILGGALKRGGIVGDWPGLAQNALFENRDTAPTLDMRGLFKGVLAEHMGVDRAVLESKVFPDSAGARPVTGLV